MLLTKTQDYFGLADAGSVQQLQQALVNLAIATNRPGINPGAVTGVMNDSTVVAVGQALNILHEQLPSTVYTILQGAMILGSATSQAKKYIEQFAPQLTIAANAAAVKYHTAPPVIAPPVTVATTDFLTNLFAPGWYKTPMGMVIIGLGLLVGYKLFIAPRNAPAAAA